MTPKHESLLAQLTTEYPEEVSGIKKYEEYKPRVSKEELESLCEGDPELTELFNEMIEYFYRYTADVCAQESLKHAKDGLVDNIEEIRDKEEPRKALHNAMIDSVNIFVRNLNKKGKDTTWFQDIDRGGRIGYANLALLITFVDILKRDHSQEAV